MIALEGKGKIYGLLMCASNLEGFGGSRGERGGVAWFDELSSL